VPVDSIKKENKMNENHKELLKSLWDLRHLTVKEALAKIGGDPNLKFLLTGAGVWFLLRLLLVSWIAGHIIYFIGRIFNLVLG
jgi:hypothetical protein